MSLSIVTGLGPRTGTSFIMAAAHKAGLPIHGERFISGVTVEKHNPDGYWETVQLPDTLDNCVVKLWSPVLCTVPQSKVGSVVVLERKNKLQQLQSIYKVFKDECKLNSLFLSFPDPSEVMTYVIELTEEWLSKQQQSKIMRIYTEDINDNLSDVLQFLQKGIPWQ